MISFFKKNNYKKFEYNSIYPSSEKKETKDKKIKFKKNKKIYRKNKVINFRLIIIIIILLLIAYLMIFEWQILKN